MKHIPLLFLGFCLPFAPQSYAQNLADQMPAGTQVYFEIPDAGAFFSGLETSSLGRIWNDPAIKDFLEPVLPMIDMGIMSLDAMLQSEGVPGGLLKTEAWKSFELGFYIDEFTANPSAMLGFAVTLSDENLAAKLAETLTLATDEANTRKSTDINITQNGNRIVFTISSFQVTGEKLNANDAFKNSRASQEEEIFLYVDLGNLYPKGTRALYENMPPTVLTLINAISDGLGISSVKHIAFSSGWQNGDSVTNGDIWFSGESSGLISSGLHSPPADLSLVDYIPANATTFAISSIDSNATWEVMSELIQKSLDLAESEHIFLPTDHPLYVWLAGERSAELAAALSEIGPRKFTWGVQDAGALMGGGASQGGTFIEVRDVAKVRATISALMSDIAKLTETNEYGSLSVKNLKIRKKNEEGKWVTSEGAEYYQVDLNIGDLLPQELAPASMLFAGLKPSTGVTEDGWLVFSTSTSATKKSMRNGVKLVEKGIKTNPDVASFLNSVPAGALQVKWSDLRPMIGGAITMAQGMLPMIAGSAGPNFPLDLNKFPGPEVFTKNICPSESWLVRKGNRLHFESTSSIGLGEGLLLGAVAGAGVVWISPASPAAPAIAMIPGPPPSIEEDVEEDEVADLEHEGGHGLSITTAELSRLQSTILVYQLETESLPLSLQDLVRPAEGWPEGFLTDGLGVRLDAWENAFIYKLDGENGFNLYSCGPNGQDEGGSGDDISIG